MMEGERKETKGKGLELSVDIELVETPNPDFMKYVEVAPL